MPKAFPKEFREDVIRVYKDSDASMAQVAKDFGISPSCLKRWLSIDERSVSQPRASSRYGTLTRPRERRYRWIRATRRRWVRAAPPRPCACGTRSRPTRF
jgi:transposase-like protein